MAVTTHEMDQVPKESDTPWLFAIRRRIRARSVSSDPHGSKDNLSAALQYAAMGLRVFPVKSDGSKKPLTKHGFKDATTNEHQINAWC